MPAHAFSVRDFGAAADGATLDHAAFNRAIDAAADAGGGAVVVPAGRYLCGTIRLRSNVTLHLEAAARVVATTDLSQYTQYGSSKWNRALVLLDGVRDAAITGEGTLDGNKVYDPTGEERMRGPHAVVLGRCGHVDIRGVTLHDAANYAVMIYESDDVDIRHVRFRGGWDGVHARGVVGRPCQRISVSHCDFSCGDDAIAGRYWDDFVITHCTIRSSCNGVRLIGPATRFVIHGCLFLGPCAHEHRTSGRTNHLAGILLQPGSWDPTTGDLDHVLITDNTMHNVATPLAVYTKPGNRTGAITVDRLTATGVYECAVSVESFAEGPIDRVSLRNLDVTFTPAAAATTANIAVEVPHVGTRLLPAWALYASRVHTLRCEHARFTLPVGDPRQPVRCVDVGEYIDHDVDCRVG